MMSRTLIIIGVIFILTGLVLGLLPKITFIGRLPGDIYWRRDNFSFYFPITTSIIISIVVTLLFYIFGRR